MERKLKIILIVLLMLLICLIGFGGIYVKKLVSYNNVLPDYELGANLEGSRITNFVLDDSTEEVIYDSEGNEVDEIPEDADESEYTTEEVAVNSEEDLTEENYEKAKEVMTKRLESMGISDYEIRLDKESGNIYVEIDEEDDTDTILSYLLITGEFKMVDTDDGTVLLTNDDIESASVLYNTSTSGVTVYLDILFTSEGKKKLEQISIDYAEIEEEETEEIEETEETESEETDSEDTEETTEETTQKTITIYIDDEEFLSTYFAETVSTGELTISIGSATTDSDTYLDYLEDAQYYATIIGNGEMPLTYTAGYSDYVYSIYSDTVFQYIVLTVLGALVLISILYMIIRYRKLGLIASIVYVATIALTLIVIRYVGIVITLESIIAAVLFIFVNTYCNCAILKNLNKGESLKDRRENLNKAYLKVIDPVIISLVLSIVFTYNSVTVMASMGMLLFWSLFIGIIMNLLFTRMMLELEVKD